MMHINDTDTSKSAPSVGAGFTRLKLVEDGEYDFSDADDMPFTDNNPKISLKNKHMSYNDDVKQCNSGDAISSAEVVDNEYMPSPANVLQISMKNQHISRNDDVEHYGHGDAVLSAEVFNTECVPSLDNPLHISKVVAPDGARNIMGRGCNEQDAAGNDVPRLVGSSVKLIGLSSRPELNGSVGEVLRFVRSKERWEVLLEGSAAGGTLALRRHNLEVLSPAVDCDSNQSDNEVDWELEDELEKYFGQFEPYQSNHACL